MTRQARLLRSIVRKATRNTRVCPNHTPHEICLCPVDGDVRRALSARFINGWLGEGLTRAANNLAADMSVSNDRLWRMLITLENSANDAYGMWQNYQ